MSRNFVNYQDLLIPLWQLTKVALYIKKNNQKKYSTFSLKKHLFIFLFCHRVSISEFHASNIPTQYKKITNKPFGNWYLCALIQLKRFSPVYSIVPISCTDHVNVGMRHDGFSLGLIRRPKRLIILCTRDTRNICPNIIRDATYVQASLTFSSYIVLYKLASRYICKQQGK